MKNDIKIIFVVWGDDFIKFFDRFVLSSYLAPGNLPYLAKSRTLYVDIWTKKKDIGKISNLRSFLRLKMLSKIKFYDIATVNDSKYGIMNNCHRISIADSNQKNHIICIASPDSVASANVLGFSADKIDQGYRAVCVVGPSATLENAEKAFQKYKSSTFLEIQPRDLMKIWFNNMNALSKSHIISRSSKILLSPSYFYFSQGSGEILARQFHLHPLMVLPQDKTIMPVGTFDLNWIEQCCRSYSNVYIIKDSDLGCFCEFSSKKTNWGQPLYQRSLFSVLINFLKNSTWKWNRLFIWENIYLHSTSSKLEKATVIRADKFIKDIFSECYPNNNENTSKLLLHLISFRNNLYWKTLSILSNAQTLFKLASYLFSGKEKISQIHSIISEKVRKIPDEKSETILILPNTKLKRLTFGKNIKIIKIVYESSGDLQQFYSLNKSSLKSRQVIFRKIIRKKVFVADE